MKPILHGVEQLKTITVTRVPSERINVSALIQTFESNLDKVPGVDWMENYKKIVPIYQSVFYDGYVPEPMNDTASYELLELAEENITGEFADYVSKPVRLHESNYFYEFARSIGVEDQASKLEEFLDEDCDFI